MLTFKCHPSGRAAHVRSKLLWALPIISASGMLLGGMLPMTFAVVKNRSERPRLASICIDATCWQLPLGAHQSAYRLSSARGEGTVLVQGFPACVRYRPAGHVGIFVFTISEDCVATSLLVPRFLILAYAALVGVLAASFWRRQRRMADAA